MTSDGIAAVLAKPYVQQPSNGLYPARMANNGVNGAPPVHPIGFWTKAIGS